MVSPLDGNCDDIQMQLVCRYVTVNGYVKPTAAGCFGNPAARSVTTEEWVTLNSVSFAAPGSFNTGACTSAGIFTAPVTGYYHAASNIRIDNGGAESYFRLALQIDDGELFTSGHSIWGDGKSTNFFTLAVSNIVKLSAGITLRFKVFCSGSCDNNLNGESHVSFFMLWEA
jgi:hypothetical protein